MSFKAFGIKLAGLRVTDFAFVQTFRLIQDQRWSTHGKALDTTGER